MSKTGTIYIIRSANTEHVYVGGTKTTLRARWANHVADAKENEAPLYRLMRKEGLENFSIDAIERNVPIRELAGRETYWLKYYNEHPDHKLLNIKIEAHDSEYSTTKSEALSKIHSGAKRSKETREKMRISRQSVVLPPRPKGISTARVRVRCVETGREYPSISEAERAVGLSGGTITAALRRENGSAGAYHWERI